jgi:hypothetical protein
LRRTPGTGSKKRSQRKRQQHRAYGDMVRSGHRCLTNAPHNIPKAEHRTNALCILAQIVICRHPTPHRATMSHPRNTFKPIRVTDCLNLAIFAESFMSTSLQKLEYRGFPVLASGWV